MALIGPRVAIFVDGCFWHGCPKHGTWPLRNGAFWREKIEANRRRDRETDSFLRSAGWKVVRIWEHDDVAHGVNLVLAAIGLNRYLDRTNSDMGPAVE